MGAPIDYDGLQVAFLGSALAHYLDLETGDILDLPFETAAPDAVRFRRIPTRTPSSETEDRQLFVAALPAGAIRERLAGAMDDAMNFRRALSEDRFIEKKWFAFKNDRATRAIEEWLRQEGLA